MNQRELCPQKNECARNVDYGLRETRLTASVSVSVLSGSDVESLLMVPVPLVDYITCWKGSAAPDLRAFRAISMHVFVCPRVDYLE